RLLVTFLVQLLVTDETPLRQRAARDGQVARFKKEFVAKRVAKVQQIKNVDNDAALALVRTITGGWDGDFEYALATAANHLLDLERAGDAAARTSTELLVAWTAARWKEGAFEGWTSFRLPRPLVFDKLVPTEPVDDVRFGGVEHDFRRREGFKLTDPRYTPREITDEA